MKSGGKKRMRLHAIRYLLHANGWEISAIGGKDYCPICRQARKGKSFTMTPEIWNKHIGLYLRIKNVWEGQVKDD
jgi:hypothetical protein